MFFSCDSRPISTQDCFKKYLRIEEFEKLVGAVLTEDEQEEDIDTLGGLIFNTVGRIPGRGELIEHKPSGIVFEILEADPRRIISQYDTH